MQLRLVLATVLGIMLGIGIAFVIVCKLIEHRHLVYNNDKHKGMLKLEFNQENIFTEDGNELTVWGIEGLRKPCPSCGKIPKGYELYDKNGGHVCVIKCCDCDITTIGCDNFEDAVKEWCIAYGENR